MASAVAAAVPPNGGVQDDKRRAAAIRSRGKALPRRLAPEGRRRNARGQIRKRVYAGATDVNEAAGRVAGEGEVAACVVGHPLES